MSKILIRLDKDSRVSGKKIGSFFNGMVSLSVTIFGQWHHMVTALAQDMRIGLWN